MKKILLLLLLCQVSSSVKHSLKVVFTASSGVSNLPEVVVVVLINDVQTAYCDSKIKTVIPKQDWMAKLRDGEPEYWKWYTGDCAVHPQLFRDEFHNLKKRLNQTGELPSVSLLQKTPSSPVTCHATGFYPDRAMMFWRKDGEEIHEDVDHSEILPNHDDTFQMSADLNLSSVTPEDWRRYDCVFHLSGVKDDIVTRLDKAEIRTNWEKPSHMTIPITVAMAVLALVPIAVTGFIINKKRKASSPPSSFDNNVEFLEELNPET